MVRHGNTYLLKISPPRGEFRSVSCTGQNQVTCIAVGESDCRPLMAITKDNGANWFLKKFNSLYNSKFAAVACQTSNGKSFCVVGLSYEYKPPQILETTDNGDHWTFKDIAGYTAPQSIFGISCIPDGYCVGDGGPAILFQRSNEKWSAVVNYT